MPTPKKRVAIIEDDIRIAQMYLMKFSSAGYEAEMAHNGQLGVELTQEMRPDIILLDVRMPVMDGPAVLAKIRSEPWGKHIPVLVLTNVGDESVAHDMEKLGIEGFLLKVDLTPSQVMQRVQAILGDAPEQPEQPQPQPSLPRE